jgi:putative nucleotidyltransferase with HDIG domain
MKRTPSKSLLNFLLAGIFSVSAQSFLLTPQRQIALLDGYTSAFVHSIALLFLLLCYLNLSLAFYKHPRDKEKLIALLSSAFLLWLISFYIQASFWVESLLLTSVLVINLGLVWQSSDERDWLGYSVSAVNILIGMGMLLSRGFFSPLVYQGVESSKVIFGSLFLGTGILRLFSYWKPFKKIDFISAKLIALPWLGWALLFSQNFEIAISPLAILFSVSLLSSGLLPFEKFRIPENNMLGYGVFPIFSFLFGILLAIFVYLLQHNISYSPAGGDLLLVFSLSLSILFIYAVMRLHYLLYLLTDRSSPEDEKSTPKGYDQFVNLLFAPVRELRPLSEWQAQKIRHLSEQLLKERQNTKRFSVISELRRELDSELDDPVAAQLVVNTIGKHFKADLVAVLLYDIENHELSALAVGGKQQSFITPSYRQSIQDGILGRSARLQKIQVVNDTTQDDDYLNMQGEKILSEVAVPLIHHGHLKGVFMVGQEEKKAFSAADIRILEAVAEELLKTWEQASHNRRMKTLIHSTISLATSLDPQNAIEEITRVARETLQARFVFVTLLDQEGTFTRTSSAGYAPNLHHFLSQDLETNPLLRVALNASSLVRIRDVRKYEYAPSITLDHNMLRGLIMIPIRLHGVSIGAILGFGKQGGVFFSKKDEALANLLASQAAAAVESAWLIQELRSTTITTTLLYQLSFGIIQTDTIHEAARQIAESAQQLTNAFSAGIVLFSLDREIETALEVTADGTASGKTVPLEFIEQTLAIGETITFASDEASAYVYLPIQTSLRKYGVLWLNFTDNQRQASSQAQTLQTLANQAAMALERVMLLLDSRGKTSELRDAYKKLENTYDQTLIALTSALDARDRETEGHSSRVGDIACRLGTELGLSEEELVALRRGALLHDIGKIGVGDSILHKPGVLTNDEWMIMRQHPEIGARIVRGIPFLEETMPIIRYHHERWNGSGYPRGLEGDAIPIMARIFAVADVFDALTSKRPYRRTSSNNEAFKYLRDNSEILFDPKIVDVFEQLLARGDISSILESS